MRTYNYKSVPRNTFREPPQNRNNLVRHDFSSYNTKIKESTKADASVEGY